MNVAPATPRAYWCYTLNGGGKVSFERNKCPNVSLQRPSKSSPAGARKHGLLRRSPALGQHRHHILGIKHHLQAHHHTNFHISELNTPSAGFVGELRGNVADAI